MERTVVFAAIKTHPMIRNVSVAVNLLLVRFVFFAAGKPSFTKKQADLFADDFPVAMQISHKYSFIYVITKLGLLFVYDLETATAVYRNRISRDPIFFTAEASSVGGFYAINRRGQVLLATVNDQTIVPFVSGQLNNLKLAVNLPKMGNLPGAEQLYDYIPRMKKMMFWAVGAEVSELLFLGI